MQHINRYVPPDVEGTTSANRLHARRPPGHARRDGTQTVRFELPFAVWCHGCQPPAIIGQGVRFNAEKQRVGHYHSTPIWRFRFRHAACGGALEVRTDPRHAAYVVTAGGRARDYGGNDDADAVRVGEGGVPILSAEERERRRGDAFAALEGRVEEKALGRAAAVRIGELRGVRERDWRDPWAANKRVREVARRERKERRREEDAVERLKERVGTEMDILPPTEEDNVRARLVSFGDEGDEEGCRKAEGKPLFVARHSASGGKEEVAQSGHDALRARLVSNTRAAMNPFSG